MQGQQIFVGGWAIDGTFVVNALLDRIGSNDAIVAYIRLSTPSIQQRVADEHLTWDEIADLCFQNPRTLHKSLDHLTLLGLINVVSVAVPRRTRPATQITIIAPTVTLPAPVEFPGAPPMDVPEPLQAATTGRGKKTYVYRPEWGTNAPQAVLKLIDDLQGGRPAKVLESHYLKNLKMAQELAVSYTPDDLRERWAKLYPKPKSWVSANYFYSIMPETQKGSAHGSTTKPTNPTSPTPADDPIRSAYLARKAKATSAG